MSTVRLVRYVSGKLPSIIKVDSKVGMRSFVSRTYHGRNNFYYIGSYLDAFGGCDGEGDFDYCVILEENESVMNCDEKIEDILNVICNINWSITAPSTPTTLEDEIVFNTQLLLSSDGYNHKIHYLGIEVYCSENDERIYHDDIDNYEMFETYLTRKITEIHKTFPKIEFIKNL